MIDILNFLRCPNIPSKSYFYCSIQSHNVVQFNCPNMITFQSKTVKFKNLLLLMIDQNCSNQVINCKNYLLALSSTLSRYGQNRPQKGYTGSKGSD